MAMAMASATTTTTPQTHMRQALGVCPRPSLPAPQLSPSGSLVADAELALSFCCGPSSSSRHSVHECGVRLLHGNRQQAHRLAATAPPSPFQNTQEVKTGQHRSCRAAGETIDSCYARHCQPLVPLPFLAVKRFDHSILELHAVRPATAHRTEITCRQHRRRPCRAYDVVRDVLVAYPIPLYGEHGESIGNFCVLSLILLSWPTLFPLERRLSGL